MRGVFLQRVFGLAVGLALTLLPVSAIAKGSLAKVEKEFKRAIEVATPATVSCVAWGVEAVTPTQDQGVVLSSSSGVIITKSGYVLTDGDVGFVRRRRGGKWIDERKEEIEVRVPDLEHGGFAAHRARVVRRERGVDSCLLQILDAPPGGFRDFLVPWTSRHVRVGDFSFVVGNAFGLSSEAPPALTVGIIASARPLPAGDAGGGTAFFYTTAAVNPGVNGGPAVDVEGRLIGTVSTWLQPTPQEPYQFLGKLVPIDRIRAAYQDLPEVAKVFPPPSPEKTRAKAATAMERVFRHVARSAGGSVVSLEIEREKPLSTKTAGSRGLADVRRWGGSVSGVVVDPDGWIVTSLYNLTNILGLLAPGAKLPPPLRLESGLQAIKKITAHLPGGRSVEAKVVAHDGRLGIALLKADLTSTGGTTAGAPMSALPPADATAFEAGRFVLALGNPFGKVRNGDPLLAFGVLSKVHSDAVPSAWRGQWQTDAGVTDANCGGALVDMRGRLLGILHIWNPLRHGRNSGIGFVATWPRIAAALPSLKRGESLKRGMMGVKLAGGEAGRVVIESVTPGSPAAKAGVRKGDRILSLDGRPTTDLGRLMQSLAFRWEGDEVALGIERDGDAEVLHMVLAPRP